MNFNEYINSIPNTKTDNNVQTTSGNFGKYLKQLSQQKANDAYSEYITLRQGIADGTIYLTDENKNAVKNAYLNVEKYKDYIDADAYNSITSDYNTYAAQKEASDAYSNYVTVAKSNDEKIKNGTLTIEDNNKQTEAFQNLEQYKDIIGEDNWAAIEDNYNYTEDYINTVTSPYTSTQNSNDYYKSIAGGDSWYNKDANGNVTKGTDYYSPVYDNAGNLIFGGGTSLSDEDIEKRKEYGLNYYNEHRNDTESETSEYDTKYANVENTTQGWQNAYTQAQNSGASQEELNYLTNKMYLSSDYDIATAKGTAAKNYENANKNIDTAKKLYGTYTLDTNDKTVQNTAAALGDDYWYDVYELYNDKDFTVDKYNTLISQLEKAGFDTDTINSVKQILSEPYNLAKNIEAQTGESQKYLDEYNALSSAESQKVQNDFYDNYGSLYSNPDFAENTSSPIDNKIISDIAENGYNASGKVSSASIYEVAEQLGYSEEQIRIAYNFDQKELTEEEQKEADSIKSQIENSILAMAMMYYTNGDEKRGQGLLLATGVDTDQLNNKYAFYYRDASEKKNAYNLTDQERDTANYIYNTQGADALIRYYETIGNELNLRGYNASNKSYQEYANEHPIASSLESIIANPLATVSTLGGWLEKNGQYSQAYALQNGLSNIRSTVAQNIGGSVGSFAYQTSMSILDNLYNMALGMVLTGGLGTITNEGIQIAMKIAEPITLGLMGTSAASQTYADAINSGYDNTFATSKAVIHAAVEIITEKMGFDNLVANIGNVSGHTLGQMLLQSLIAGGKSSIPESLEEGAANWFDRIGDSIIDALAGRENEFQQKMLEYVNSGMDYGEACSKAFKGFLSDDMVAELAGGFSGFTMGTSGGMVNAVQTSVRNATDSTLNGTTDKTVKSTDTNGKTTKTKVEANVATRQATVETLKTAKEIASNDSELGTKIDSVIEQIENGEKVSNTTINTIVEDAAESYANTIANTETEEYNNAYTRAINEIYGTNQRANAVYNAISNSDSKELDKALALNDIETLTDTSTKASKDFTMIYGLDATRENIALINEALDTKVDDTFSVNLNQVERVLINNNGELTVELRDGSIAHTENLVLDGVESEIVNAMSNMPVTIANGLYKMYQAYSGDITSEAEAKVFADAFIDVATDGRIDGGTPNYNNYSAIINEFGEDFVKVAYQYGVNQHDISTHEVKSRGIETTQRGSVKDNTTDKSQSKNAIKLSKKIANKIGVNITVTDHIEGGADANYNQSNNTITIAMDGKRGAAWSVFHEMFEYVDANNSKTATTIIENLNQWYKSQIGAKAFNQTLNAYREAYAEAEKSKSERSAMKEMAADAMANMFQGKDGAKAFGKWLNANCNTQTKSKIKEFIDNIIEILSDLFGNTKKEDLNIVQQDILDLVATDSTGDVQEALAKFRNEFLNALDETSEMTKQTVENSEGFEDISYDDVEKIIKNKSLAMDDANTQTRKSLDLDKNGNGYDGYSMSNNAREAYADGEKPLSKWTKSTIIDEIGKYDKDKANILKSLPLSELKNKFLYKSSWHHTGKMYNKTDFYSLDTDSIDKINSEGVSEILDGIKEAKEFDKIVAEQEKTRSILKDKIKKYFTEHLVSQFNADAKRIYENYDSSDVSKSGAIYEHGRKPNRTDYEKGLENYFNAGEKRLNRINNVNSDFPTLYFPEELTAFNWASTNVVNLGYSHYQLEEWNGHDWDVVETYKNNLKIPKEFTRQGKISHFNGLADTAISYSDWSNVEWLNSIYNEYEVRETDEDLRHSYAGVQSRTANTDMLEKAKNLEKHGVDYDTIRKKTGWFKGVDNIWKYELSNTIDKFDYKISPETLIKNAMSRNNKIREYKLGDVIKAKELFEAYPELKDYEFVVSSDLSKYVGGDYTNSLHRIRINLADLKGRVNIEEVRSNIAHEIQHAIQHIEGTYPNDPSMLRSKAVAEYNEIINSGGIDKYSKLTALANLIDRYNRQYHKEYFNNGNAEAEARDVQKRLNYSDEERANTSPAEISKSLKGEYSEEEIKEWLNEVGEAFEEAEKTGKFPEELPLPKHKAFASPTISSRDYHEVVTQNKIISSINERLEQELKLTNKNSVSYADCEEIATKIIGDYASDVDLKAVSKEIQSLARLHKQGAAEGQLTTKAKKIAQMLLEKSSAIYYPSSESQNIANAIKEKTFRLSKEQRNAIESFGISVDDFIKANEGKVSIGNVGLSATTLWDSLCSQYPEVFDRSMPKAEIPTALVTISNILTEKYIDGVSYTDLVDVLSGEILNDYANYNDMERHSTIADELSKVKSDLKEQTEKYSKLNEQFAKAQERYEEKLNKEKENTERAKEKTKETRREYKMKMENLKSFYNYKMAQQRQNAKISILRGKLKTQINEYMRDINKLLKHPKEGRFVPTELMQQVYNVCEVVRIANNGSNAKISEAISNMKKSIMNSINSENTEESDLFDEDIYTAIELACDNILHEVDANGNLLPLGRMSAIGLESFNQLLGMTYSRVVNRAKAFTLGKYKTIQDAADTLAETSETYAHKIGAPGILMGALRPKEIFEMLGGYSKNNAFVDNLYKSWDIAQQNKNKYKYDAFDSFSELIGFDKDTVEQNAEKYANNYANEAVKSNRLNEKNTGETTEQARERIYNEAKAKYIQDHAIYKLFDKMTSTSEKDMVDISYGKASSGKTIKMNRDFMINLYLNLLYNDNKQAVIDGGLRIPDFKKYYNRTLENRLGYGGDTYDGSYVKHFSEEEINYMLEDIESKLDDYDKTWIRLTEDFFYKASVDMNKVLLEMYGFEKPMVQGGYYPIARDMSTRATDISKFYTASQLTNMGILQQRTGSHLAVKLQGHSQVINRYISQYANLCALSEIQYDFKRLLNSKVEFLNTDRTDENGNPLTDENGNVLKEDESLQQLINRKMGSSKYIKYLNELMEDLTGTNVAKGRSAQVVGNIINNVRGNVARAALTLNMGVALGQAGSYWQAGNILSYKSLAKALAYAQDSEGNAHIRADKETINKYTTLYRYRSAGNPYTGLENFSGVTKMSMLDKAYNKLPAITQWINKVDATTVGRLWTACIYDVQDNNSKWKNFKLNSASEFEKDKFFTDVAELFNQVIEETQPNYSTMQRSSFQRSDNEILKSLSMFMTQRLQNLSIAYSSIARAVSYQNQYNQGLVTKEELNDARLKVGRALGSVAAGTFTLVIFKEFAQAILHQFKKLVPGQDDDKEENITLANAGWQTLLNFGDSMASNIPFMGEIYEFVEAKMQGTNWYGFNTNGLSTVTDFVSNISTDIDSISSMISKGNLDSDKITQLVADVCEFVGIPFSQAKNYWDAIEGWAKDFKNASETGTFKLDYGLGYDLDTQSGTVKYSYMRYAEDSSYDINADIEKAVDQKYEELLGEKPNADKTELKSDAATSVKSSVSSSLKNIYLYNYERYNETGDDKYYNACQSVISYMEATGLYDENDTDKGSSVNETINGKWSKKSGYSDSSGWVNTYKAELKERGVTRLYKDNGDKIYT